jgi:hypothetical protein
VKQAKKRVKGSLFYLFLKLVQINYVFCENESILYIKEEKLVRILWTLLHKCCGEKNIRVRDIFFWNEQYLHDWLWPVMCEYIF